MKRDFEISTVSYPDKDTEDKISRWRQIFVTKFNSKKALVFKPHLTIAERVLIPKDRLEDIANQIREVCQNTDQMQLQTTDLEFVSKENSPFKSPYIVWISVKISPGLKNLNRKINNEIYRGLIRPSMKSSIYSPHFTLAYRDLTKENFEKARKYFSNDLDNFKFTFTLNSLMLILHKDKNSAEDFIEFELGS